MGRVYGLKRREIISHVILPGALPAFFVGLRYVVWGGADMSPDEVAAGVNRLLAEGVLRR